MNSGQGVNDTISITLQGSSFPVCSHMLVLIGINNYKVKKHSEYSVISNWDQLFLPRAKLNLNTNHDRHEQEYKCFWSFLGVVVSY